MHKTVSCFSSRSCKISCFIATSVLVTELRFVAIQLFLPLPLKKRLSRNNSRSLYLSFAALCSRKRCTSCTTSTAFCNTSCGSAWPRGSGSRWSGTSWLASPTRGTPTSSVSTPPTSTTSRRSSRRSTSCVARRSPSPSSLRWAAATCPGLLCSL